MSHLLAVFRDKLIPWAEDDLAQRLIVARPMMKKSLMPYGVQISQQKIVGKRVIIRDHRDYGKQRIYRAQWLEAGLHELEIPKLVCVVDGFTDFIAGKYIISCGEGHFILLPPHVPNTYGNRSHLENERRCGGFCRLVQMQIFRDTIQCWPCESSGEEHHNDPNTHCLIRHPQAVQLFHLFMEESLNCQEDSPLVCGHLLPAFFSLLHREIKAGHTLSLLSNTPESPSLDEPMQMTLDYIKTHLNQPLTIEKVAHQVYMSPAQFTRYVRRETGHSFVEVLTECRLEEAKILLQDTGLSVAVISGLVGFKSPTYFSDLFRREIGTTPGKFRTYQR